MSGRKQKFGAPRRAIALGTIPLALAIACSACSSSIDRPTAAPAHSPQASAGSPRPGIPDRPGTARPSAPEAEHLAPQPAAPCISVQPGVAQLPGHAVVRPTGPVQPGVTTPPEPQAPSQARPDAPGPLLRALPDYAVPRHYRAIPAPQEPAPPVEFRQLHAPEPVAPVAPIAPPPRTLRMGDFVAPAPDELPDDALDTVNTVAAGTEAAIATGFNSIGIDPSRSDKIAGGTIAGAATGAAVGATAAGVPMAVVGAVPGAVVGAGVGAGVGAAVGTLGVAVAPGLALIDIAGGAAGGALIGAAVGGAAGAAAVGIPAAVAGGVAGGGAGAAVGGGMGSAL